MHAAQQDTRIVPGTRDRVAEHFRVAPQGLQQPDKRVMSPGHHVSQHQPPFLRQCKRRLEPSQIRGLDDRGLVGQHVQAGFESRDDPLDLAAVAAREDGDTARRLVSHPVEKIGAGMHVEPPIGGGS